MQKRNIFVLVLACMVWVLAGCGDSGDTATHYITGTPLPTPTPTGPVYRDITLSVLDENGAAFTGASVILTGDESVAAEDSVDESGILYLTGIAEGDYTVTAPGFSETSAPLAIVPETDAYEVRLQRAAAENPGFILMNPMPAVGAAAVNLPQEIKTAKLQLPEGSGPFTDEDQMDFFLLPMQGAGSAGETVYSLTYANGVWTAGSAVPAGAYRIGGIYNGPVGPIGPIVLPEVKISAPDGFTYLSGIVAVTTSRDAQQIEFTPTLLPFNIRILKDGTSLQPKDILGATLGGLPFSSYDGTSGFAFKNCTYGAFNLFVQLKDGTGYLIPIDCAYSLNAGGMQIELDSLINTRPRFILTQNGNPLPAGDAMLYPNRQQAADSGMFPIQPLVRSENGNLWQLKGLTAPGKYRIIFIPEQSMETIESIPHHLSSATVEIKDHETQYELPMHDTCYYPIAFSVNGHWITMDESIEKNITIELDECFAQTALPLTDPFRAYFLFERPLLGGVHTVTLTLVNGDETFLYTGTVTVSGNTPADVPLTGDKDWPFTEED